MRHAPLSFLRPYTLLGICGIGIFYCHTVHAAIDMPAAAALPSLATQSGGPAEERSLGSDWLAVSDDKLNELRGGFDFGPGLKVSLGIERAVYINGNLVTTTSISIPDVARITTDQASALRAASGTVNVVQNGPGNTFDPGPVSSSTIGTVIQNTLNNQNIKNLTVIDATANSVGLMKNINFQSSLRDALSTAAGGK